jgi:hypothetical protein
MMITGTAYFPTLKNAIRYYRVLEGSNAKAVVDRKLKEGEIFIGRPELKKGQWAFVREYRWHIQED